ncbi:MAG TPA: (5-formylfuran-3-yl)methyl phosphate synthase [Gemmatales bacterium]|nr:(5-formylfuran-3-yl)methyl phosphate synthase [Gemmatales bacterium]
MPGRPPRLLVSVRNTEEALAALAGGADILDIKEPLHGSLGRAPSEIVDDIRRLVPGHVPLSLALGEWHEIDSDINCAHVSYAKAGWAQGITAKVNDWQKLFHRVQPAKFIGVVYADHSLVRAPGLETVLGWLLSTRQTDTGLLIDTAIKDGRNLLYWFSLDMLQHTARLCLEHGLFLALAGSLQRADIPQLVQEVKPDIIAVRGAACGEAGRLGQVQTDRVRSLVECLREGS